MDIQSATLQDLAECIAGKGASLQDAAQVLVNLLKEKESKDSKKKG